MGSTCEIKESNKTVGVGTVLKVGDKMGFITSSKLIPSKDAFSKLTVIIEDADFQPTEVELKSTPLVNEDIGLSFVECKFDMPCIDDFFIDYSDEHLKGKKGTEIRNVDELFPLKFCSGYSFDGEGVKMNYTITILSVDEKAETITLQNSPLKYAGCPIFMGDRLLSVTSETSEGILVSQIIPWIKNGGDNVGDNVWNVGDNVEAQWTDGYFYPAVLLYANNEGWHVNWYQFDNTEGDVELNQLKAVQE